MSEQLVLSESQIIDICKRLGKEISETIKSEDKIPVIVGVLKGAMPFMMDLIKYIEVPVYLDFIQICSYQGTKSTGKVQLLKDTSFDCEDRTVILVEDIVDSGLSINFLKNHFLSHNPKRVMICTLFDKKEARKVPTDIDFTGYVLTGNDFLLGYGLDYNELFRNIPYVIKVDEEDVKRYNEILHNDK